MNKAVLAAIVLQSMLRVLLLGLKPTYELTVNIFYIVTLLTTLGRATMNLEQLLATVLEVGLVLLIQVKALARGLLHSFRDKQGLRLLATEILVGRDERSLKKVCFGSDHLLGR